MNRIELKKLYYTYDELKSIVNKVEIKSNKSYLSKYKELTNKEGIKAPQKPYMFYKGEWVDWYSFIPERVTEKCKNKEKYLNIEELTLILIENKIQTVEEYRRNYKKLTNVNGAKAPINPHIYYGDVWIGWGNILYKNSKYYTYEELKNIVCEYKIKTSLEYVKTYKKLKNSNGIKAPRKPEYVYSEWEGWGLFLGTGIVANVNKKFLDYDTARKWVIGQNLKCCSDWDNIKNKPSNIPSNPESVYKYNGWVNSFEWIGIKNNLISKGESIIMGFLDENNFDYKYNCGINGCKHKIKLRFDFIINSKNVCIEYDGLQHYVPIKYFGGEKHFNGTKERDKIKDKFCKENSINLIRVPYYLKEKEIIEFLSKELLQKK